MILYSTIVSITLLALALVGSILLVPIANVWARNFNSGPENDHRCGTNQKDVYHGDGGNDTFCGKKGNDVLFGGSGADTLVGGKGRDFIYTLFTMCSGDDDGVNVSVTDLFECLTI